MCGLCGVYSTTWGTPETDFFKHLLMLNFFRGEHSTGVVRVNKDGKIKTRRTLLTSPAFLASPSSDILDSKTGEHPMALLGHTRHATKGEVILKNAHPFSFDKVVGMHNGTVHTSFRHRKEFDTDSEALYRNINDYGLEDTLNEIEAYDTAYALQWIDKERGTLNFVKNSARPLHFTYIYGGTALLWSSEQRMLEFALHTKKYSGNSGWKGDTKDKIFTLHEHDHLSVRLGDHARDSAVIEKIEVKKKYSAVIRPSTGSGTTRVRTDGNSSIEAKDWIQDAGGVYRLVTKAEKAKILAEKHQRNLEMSQAGKNSSTSQSQTSTKTDGTSERTGGCLTTSTAVTAPQSDEQGTNGGVLGDSYRSFRDKFGKDLATLPWLNSADDSKDTKGPLADLFDTNFADANRAEANQKESSGESVGRTGEVPWSDDGHLIKAGTFSVSEGEFRFRLSEGCSCCGVIYDMDDAHDFTGINSMHWSDRTTWFCDDCFNSSEGDWVRWCFPEEIEKAS